MFGTVLDLLMGLILMGVVVGVVATQNATSYGVGGAAILGIIGIIGLLLVVSNFVTGMRSGSKKIF